MPRIARKDINSNFLHIMVQGINKSFIFEREYYKKKYLEIVQENCEKYNVTLLSYCIMGNHAHLLIFVENVYNLSKVMANSNTKYSQWYNYIFDRCGVVFRNKYAIEPIYNEKYLINCINYIHNNPVKAEMVSKPGDYKYSTYNDYCNQTGAYNNSILQELFGKNWNYKDYEKECFDVQYMEADGDKLTDEQINAVIESGLKYYIKLRHRSFVDLLTDKIFLKDAIDFLKKECKVNYSKISDYLEMPKYYIKNFNKQKISK